MSTTTVVTTLVTFCFFFVEALLHFNIGRTGKISLAEIPNGKELAKIAAVVAVFYLFSGIVSYYVV
jgi:hypothetical protein